MRIVYFLFEWSQSCPLIIVEAGDLRSCVVAGDQIRSGSLFFSSYDGTRIQT